MIRGNLPPQAYTREVVANAYNWLQSQPEPIRRMAQNTDTLVALYLRAKRNGESAPHSPQATIQHPENDTPASSENFRSQLKNLASEIQQFVPDQEKYSISAPQVEAPPVHTPPSQHHQTPRFNNLDLNYLDPQSLEILKKVRQHLNLGSDIEAMRMLLVLGFEKVQTLFKGN